MGSIWYGPILFIHIDIAFIPIPIFCKRFHRERKFGCRQSWYTFINLLMLINITYVSQINFRLWYKTTVVFLNEKLSSLTYLYFVGSRIHDNNKVISMDYANGPRMSEFLIYIMQTNMSVWKWTEINECIDYSILLMTFRTIHLTSIVWWTAFRAAAVIDSHFWIRKYIFCLVVTKIWQRWFHCILADVISICSLQHICLYTTIALSAVNGMI